MTYLIIGASSDVGKSYIGYLNDKYEGAGDKPAVIAHYNSSVSAFEKLRTDSISLHTVRADLSEEDGVEKLLKYIKDNGFEVTHFVFLPAARFEYCRIKEIDKGKNDSLDKDMRIQAYSFIRLCAGLLPGMKKRAFGRVAVMLTKYTADDMPPANMSPYIICKYALLGAMKAAASEYGGKGIKINAVSPDMMDTAFLGNIDLRIKELAAQMSSTGRLIMPGEIAPFIDDLMSEETDCNGENILITGEMAKERGGCGV